MYKDKYIKYKAKYLDIMSEINSKNLNQTGGFNEIEISSIDHEGGGFFDNLKEKAFKIKDKTPFINGPEDNFNIFNEHREYSSKITTGERKDKISKLHGYFTKYKQNNHSRVIQFAICVRFADFETSAKELLLISDPNYNLLEQDDITLTGKLYVNSQLQEEGDFILSITEESLSYSVNGEVTYEISDDKLKSSEILVASSASYITSIPIAEKSKIAKKIILTINGDRKKYKLTQSGLDALSAADQEFHIYSDMIKIPKKGIMGMFREGEVAVNSDVSINSEEFQNY